MGEKSCCAGSAHTRRPLVELGLIIVIIFSIIPLVPNGRASSTGLVCLVPHGSTTCQSNRTVITGQKGSAVSVDVFIQGSDSMNGFDIILLADHSILAPFNVTLGNVLPGESVVLFCLGGKQIFPPPIPGIVSTITCSSVDTADTIELIASAGPGQITFPPTSGLLFSAIYNVSSTTTGTPVGFPTGCSPSSVSGTTTCIAIFNGSVSPAPETSQGATFVTPQLLTFSFNGVTFELASILRNDTSTSRLIGTIQVTATNTTTGQIIVSKTFSVNVTFPGKNQIIPVDRSASFIIVLSSLRDGILCFSSPANAPLIQCFATYNPDVFQFGQVNILDVGALLLAYNSRPGLQHWNPYYDFDLDGMIGIVDVSIEFRWYGSPIIA